MYILYSRMKAESPLCHYHRENTTYLFETLKNFRMTNIAFWIDCCIELVLF